MQVSAAVKDLFKTEQPTSLPPPAEYPINLIDILVFNLEIITNVFQGKT